MRPLFPVLALLALGGAPALAADFPVDRVPTSGGELAITLLDHASLSLSWRGKVVYLDPWAKVGDLALLPKADLILVTHDHQDHMDSAAIALLSKVGTVVAANPGAGAKLAGAAVLRNGESGTFAGIPVKAVPAYNLVHKRAGGVPYHPKGEGNGYLITFGETKVYVAGDTEDIPEMREMQGVDIAFLPVNLPYTMTPEMLVEAAKLVRPKILYPYHTGDTDMNALEEKLSWVPGVEVRIRPME